MFALIFLARMLTPLLPGFVELLIAIGLNAWLLADLPIALQRVYGGSRPLLMGAALLQF